MSQPAFSFLGAVFSLYLSYRAASFLYLHLRPSSLPRYLSHEPGKEVWALVTGASDGIGQGFAQELSHQGFNVILHGRNEAKLARVQSELQAQAPNRKFRIFIADGEDADTSVQVKNLVKSLQGDDIHLTVLINNVGGAGSAALDWGPFEGRSAATHDSFINLNARFPTQLTRAVLPLMYANSAALIINIGSAAAVFPVPYASVYSGVKAYNMAWSRSLKAELLAEGRTGMEVMGVNLFYVQSNATSPPRPVTLFTPSSRDMAKAALSKVGSGKAVVMAYWPHALQGFLLGLLPDAITEKVVTSMALKAKARRMKQN